MPWKYWDVRDTRTIYDAATVKIERGDKIHHHAFDDAQAQAEAVCRAYRQLGLAETLALK